MSVVNLLLQIGNIISNFLCKKRMCTDIMNNLLNNQKIQRIYIKNDNNDKNEKKFNSDNIISKKNKKNKRNTSLGNMNIKIENTSNLDNSNDEKDGKSKGSINKLQKNINNIQINNKIFELIYFLIFKSFFCCENTKTKLVNLLQDFVIENLSIEKIFERIFNLEKIYKRNFNSMNEENDFSEFSEINKLINDINVEIENEKELNRKKTMK